MKANYTSKFLGRLYEKFLTHQTHVIATCNQINLLRLAAFRLVALKALLCQQKALTVVHTHNQARKPLGVLDSRQPLQAVRQP